MEETQKGLCAYLHFLYMAGFENNTHYKGVTGIRRINKLHIKFTTNYIYIKWKTYRFFLPGVFYTTPGPPGATGDSSPRHIAGY